MSGSGRFRVKDTVVDSVRVSTNLSSRLEFEVRGPFAVSIEFPISSKDWEQLRLQYASSAYVSAPPRPLRSGVPRDNSREAGREGVRERDRDVTGRESVARDQPGDRRSVARSSAIAEEERASQRGLDPEPVAEHAAPGPAGGQAREVASVAVASHPTAVASHSVSGAHASSLPHAHPLPGTHAHTHAHAHASDAASKPKPSVDPLAGQSAMSAPGNLPTPSSAPVSSIAPLPASAFVCDSAGTHAIRAAAVPELAPYIGQLAPEVTNPVALSADASGQPVALKSMPLSVLGPLVRHYATSLSALSHIKATMQSLGKLAGLVAVPPPGTHTGTHSAAHTHPPAAADAAPSASAPTASAAPGASTSTS